MNTDGTGFHTCKKCHKTESTWNHTTTDHKEGEQLEDRRSVGASSCNFGDGTDQRFQSLMFMTMMMISNIMGRDSSVGIATRYGLDGPGIESRWGGGEIFHTRPDHPWDLYMRTGSFPGVKRDIDHPPHLAPRLKKERSYISTPPLCFRSVF